MAKHQQDTNCNELWLYFKSIIDWVQVIFPHYRKEMRGRDWGVFFNKYGGNPYDAKIFEAKILELMEDNDVTNNAGIYEYLLSGEEKHLSIRAFTSKMVRTAFEKQKGICLKCGKSFTIEEMQADHITPWSKGGKTIAENCQMLCTDCNRRKSNR